MINIFIDTDVILDFLTDRRPFSTEATSIFTLIDQNKIKGYTSSLTYSNLYYVLRKYSTHKKVILKLEELSKFVDILKVDEQIIKSALSSDFKDFEDAIQCFSAQKEKKIDVIITRNIKDYKESELPVMTPGTFIKTYEQTSGT
ncbi:MAG: PIN domain-containing protein [Bacteroidales bacterium]|nr:PIN domain-containing protein [Bacteroidales bacterium]